MKKYSRNQASDVVRKASDVVRIGYDRLGNRYTAEREKFDNWAEVKAFTSLLPAGGKVLDAGSGTGMPVAEFLVKSGFEVVGIDISSGMVETAHKNVPGATFRQMDMTELDFPPESFDGLISTYAIFHVPREMHAGIFRSFHTILKPQGVMLVSVASCAWEEFADYMGVDMFWSHYDPDKSQSLITAAGFEIEFGRDVETGGEKHHWVLARKR
jgi:ubiquinone/menaquinone biosynthesis C-methylase UbiE